MINTNKPNKHAFWCDVNVTKTSAECCCNIWQETLRTHVIGAVMWIYMRIVRIHFRVSKNSQCWTKQEAGSYANDFLVQFARVLAKHISLPFGSFCVCVFVCLCTTAHGVTGAGSCCPSCGLGSPRWHCIVQHGQLSVSHKWPHSSSASHTITPRGLISPAHTWANTWSIPHGTGGGLNRGPGLEVPSFGFVVLAE